MSANNELGGRGHIGWDEFYMGTAIVASLRSKDPIVKVGACVVNPQGYIVGVGYNGMPNIPGDNDKEFSWTKEQKSNFVCHAELNAIVRKNVENCAIYLNRLPCNECAKLIIQSGIKKVVYMNDMDYNDKYKHSKPMLKAAGVEYQLYKPPTEDYKLELKFSSE